MSVRQAQKKKSARVNMDCNNVTHVDSEICAICLESLGNNKKKCDLECSHSYHTQCILQSFKQDIRCPICRVDMVDTAEPPKDTDTDRMGQTRRGRAVIEINLNEFTEEFLEGERQILETERQIRNYNSKVNRYVKKNAHLQQMKEAIKTQSKDCTAACNYLKKEWCKVEREAWHSTRIQNIRNSDAKKRRKLNATVNRYNSILEEQFGEKPQRTTNEFVSLEALLRGNVHDLTGGMRD